jgi:lipoate-protein ligase A
MHGIIAAALHGNGVHAHLHEGAEVVKGPGLCFLAHTPGDVVLDEAKIVGSAQRRRHGALLQHGAILLAQSPFTPPLPGLRELADIAITPAECITSIRAATVSGTGWQLADNVWTADEHREIERLTVEKYATTTWTNKR